MPFAVMPRAGTGRPCGPGLSAKSRDRGAGKVWEAFRPFLCAALRLRCARVVWRGLRIDSF